MSCPNTNLPEWKLLVASRGEDVAYALWDLYEGNVPESESKSEIVKSNIKVVNSLFNLSKPKETQFSKKYGGETQPERITLRLNTKDRPNIEKNIRKTLNNKGVPDSQVNIMFDFMKNNNLTEISTQELALQMAANYSYAVEINVAKESMSDSKLQELSRNKEFQFNNYKYFSDNEGYWRFDNSVDSLNKRNLEKIDLSDYTKAYRSSIENSPTQVYSNLTVPGGTNYTENEIATPAITPSIKGHAQFATDQGIGWFRSDEKSNSDVFGNYYVVPNDSGRYIVQSKGSNGNIDTIPGTFVEKQQAEDFVKQFNKNNPVFLENASAQNTKTRRILEVQSDLFQKGRDKNDLVTDKFYKSENEKSFILNKEAFLNSRGIYYKNGKEISEKEFKNALTIYNQDTTINKANKFLQLLNKDNNWVTFFVKSIIQDSAKKGYEKVLFPSGDTASKVEGHTTLEEFKKQKEDRLQKINNDLDLLTNEYGLPEGQKYFYSDAEYIVFKEGKLVEHKFNPSNYQYIDVEINKDRLEAIKNFGGNKSLDRNAINKLTIPGALKAEKKQLEQEIERVETEGFGALKPIYNFYENTVTNVLNKQYGKENVKQVTDEYGNTWNEVEIVPEREEKTILLQTEEMPGSKSSKETLDVLKAAAKQMGIDIQSLEEYAKAHPEIDVKGVNGLADLIKGVIAVAQGMENVATTEEIVHIATAILEQTNPKLITALIAKIDRFKIYKQVLAIYGKRKEYQLSNGKPDIRKIKKEAVDKLIAELIVYNSEGSTEFPELTEEETRNMIQEIWNTILDYIRGIYSKTNIDLFDVAASRVATGNVGGTVADIKTKGIFFNISDEVKKQIDDYYNTIVENADQIEGPFPEVKDASGKVIDTRHYIYKGVRVAKSVTEKVKEQFKKQFTRTEAEILVDNQKRDWGSEGHRFIEKYILKNLIDKDGYVKDKFGNDPIKSTLMGGLQVKLGEYAQMLINSYPEGTRFLVEKKVVNTKVKGMLASTVDFKAIYPVKKSDGTQDFKVDTLDWKFTTVDKTKDEDLSWFKIREWVPQMGEYTLIDQNYGLRRDQIGKARMIPFIVNYDNSVPSDKKSPLIPTSLEIGKLDSLKETTMYLLPVPSLAESTGNPEVDALVSSLQTQYEKMFKKRSDDEDEFSRRQALSQLSKAIRNLHVKLNFEPLYNVADTFLKNAKTAIDEFEKIDYANLDEAALKKGIKELLEYSKGANKFASMDEVFLSQYPKAGMTEQNKKILDGLEDVTKSTQRMQEKILKLQKLYAANLAVKQGIVSEENKMTVVEAEAAINGFAKNWAEGTRLSAKIIKLASNLIMNASSMVNRETSKQIKMFGDILIPLEQAASAQGKKAFDLIGKMTPSGPELIKKLDKEFLDAVKKAKDDKDTMFLMSNMNMTNFNDLAKDYLEKNLKVLDNTRYSLDEKDDVRMREIHKANLRNSIDINREKFNGFNDYNFNKLFNQTIIEKGHYSKEYEQMSKNEAALKMWNFLTALNEKGKTLGYLQGKSISFFPLIEATTLEKFGKTSNVIAETGDFFKGLYSTKINEEQNMSKIDPETGKVKKVIPKYFTSTDKSYNQLSTDLNKVGALWIKSLLEYESSINMEDTLQTLLAVENAKGSLTLDENGSVQFDSSNKPIIQKENKNAAILETIVDDSLYKLEQDLGSIGNIGISTIAGKFSKTEEGKQKSTVNIKKTLRNADTLTRALAVGLKPLIALANTFGSNFQSYINAGGLYKFWTEYVPNELKVSTNRLSLIEKGLLHMMVPLNEDVVTEERRRVAMKQGTLKWLSTWSFSDIMMSTNAFPEKKLQLANALSIIENSMVINGKVINIRQHLAAQDRQIKYKMSESERKELENTFEDRVKELKESSSLVNIAKIEGDEIVIPGVTEEELAKFRTQIIEYGRKLNGQMNQDNKAGYRRDAIFSSFMMFKTWIPKLVAERTTDITKNVEVGNWEYGRTRAFIKTWAHLGTRNIMTMRDILNGTEEGLRILDEMLQDKRDEHFRKTGQELDITKEEFYDLMRKELTNQLKELKLLVLVMTTLVAAKAAEPPEDASALEKNRYKWWAKALNKISDEITFYYNPLSFEGMTKGSILPSLSLLTKVERVFIQFYKEFGDEPDKAYPQKAIFNLIPGLSQFQTEILPFIDPELAKEWGIRVTAESRR